MAIVNGVTKDFADEVSDRILSHVVPNDDGNLILESDGASPVQVNLGRVGERPFEASSGVVIPGSGMRPAEESIIPEWYSPMQLNRVVMTKILSSGASVSSIVWDPSGLGFFIGSDASPYLDFYARGMGTDGSPEFISLGSTFITGGIPTSAVNTMALSAFSALAVGLAASPYISVYVPNAQGVYVNTSNASPVPPAAVSSLAWSLFGGYLFAGYGAAPYMTMYKMVNSQPVAQSFSEELPGVTPLAMDMSSNGKFLAVGQSDTPYIYQFDEGVDTINKPTEIFKVAEISAGVGTVQGLSWSPDTQYLAIVGDTAPYLKCFKRSVYSFTEIEIVDSLPGAARFCHWLADGKYLAVGYTGAPGVKVYSRLGDSVEGLPGMTSALSGPSVIGQAVRFSPDGYFLTVGGVTSPALGVYYSSLLQPKDVATGIIYPEDPAPPSGGGISEPITEPLL